jgi:MATE family multidrug resistance protein
MMGVVDSLMVGTLGSAPLAAASLGNSITMLIFIIGIGVSFAVTPLVAISVGAKKFSDCGIYFRQSLLVNLSFGFILMTIVILCSEFLVYLDQPAEVLGQAKSYTRILGLGALPIMLFQTYKQFIEGLSVMKPAMVITILANIINLMIYVMNKKYFKQYDVSFHFKNINIPVIKKILSLGFPSGIQYFFEIGAFAFAVIMIGWLGTEQLAAHQIAINLASISFMIVLGLSMAGGIRVGNAVGEKYVTGVRRAGFTAIFLALCVMSVSGLIFIVFRNYLPTLYIDDETVISIASSLLIIAALFQLSDGVQAVGIGILRGLTDVKIPTAITFIAYWVVGLPTGYLLAFYFGLDVQGVWIGLLAGLTTSAILLTLRFNLKSKHIITV